jgi:UDPglucose--hexose-1-phosphate uridylyltransferase
VPEVRVDPLSGLKTIIADDRAARPGSGIAAPPADPPIDPAGDPFLEGHEDRTPPELDALRPDGSAPGTPGWLVRVVPNLYPALVADAVAPPREARVDLFAAQPAQGAHEVIVNTPEPVGSIGDLAPEQLERAMGMWRRRTAHHAERGAAAVHLFVNDGRAAGASQPHTHAQLVALPFVPARIARERERFGAYATSTMGGNLLGDLVQEEVRLDQRVIAIDEEAVALAPYASTGAYQVMLVPRRPAMRWEDADQPLGAGLLRDVLGRLAAHFGRLPPLNLWIRTAPRGAEHFCWRIDVRPRLAQAAGLELGTGLDLNPVAPERAARELRDAGA